MSLQNSSYVPQFTGGTDKKTTSKNKLRRFCTYILLTIEVVRTLLYICTYLILECKKCILYFILTASYIFYWKKTSKTGSY